MRWVSNKWLGTVGVSLRVTHSPYESFMSSGVFPVSFSVEKGTDHYNETMCVCVCVCENV